MSCNSCSNVTLPGVPGPAGPGASNWCANGAAWCSHCSANGADKRAARTPAQPGAEWCMMVSTLTLDSSCWMEYVCSC